MGVESFYMPCRNRGPCFVAKPKADVFCIACHLYMYLMYRRTVGAGKQCSAYMQLELEGVQLFGLVDSLPLDSQVPTHGLASPLHESFEVDSHSRI